VFVADQYRLANTPEFDPVGELKWFRWMLAGEGFACLLDPFAVFIDEQFDLFRPGTLGYDNFNTAAWKNLDR
jgi:hypothetical protein